MKQKIKVEEDMTTPISTNQTSSSTSSSSSLNNKGVNINIKKKDLSDPNVQKNIGNMKTANVNIVDESNDSKITNKLEYLSEIKGEDGQIPKHFTIDGKRYQMVRAVDSNRKKTTGVYSLDEVDANGVNVIYDVNEFENNIAKKNITTPKEKKLPAFSGYKYFIVNKNKQKAKKFKTIGELAKANMKEDEEYMGVKTFKKYLDEVLFGGNKKKSVVEDDGAGGGGNIGTQSQTQGTNQNNNTEQPQQNSNQPVADSNDIKIVTNAQKLVAMIKTKIPQNAASEISNNPLAQREIIAQFSELIGVKRDNLAALINGTKDLSQVAKNVNTNTQNTQN